ncbi:MAG: hypothetical protein ACRDWS_10500 [Acidimicrobiia bacterium]
MSDKIWSLRAALRRLWADHVSWTRQYVVAAIDDTPLIWGRPRRDCSRIKRTSGAQ